MKKIISLFFCALILTLQHLYAQQLDSLQQLNEVVITATKFSKSLNETGKSMIVIDATQLQQARGKTLSDVLNEQVGLIVNGAQGNRGMNKSIYLQGASNKHTMILLDGIPLYDPSGIGGTFDLRMLDLNQVDRIEILKGSQSTLYGTDAIAGVINIISNQKFNKKFQGSGALQYGSYGTFMGRTRFKGKLGFIQYDGGYDRHQTKGISEALDLHDVGFDKDGMTKNSYHTKLKITASERLTFSPYFRYAVFKGKYDNGPYTDDITATFNSTVSHYGVNSSYTLPKGLIRLTLSKQQAERDYESVSWPTQYHGSVSQGELFFHHDVVKNFQLAGGTSIQTMTMQDIDDTEKDPSYSISSPYLSFYLKDFHRISFEISSRYAHHSSFGKAMTYQFNSSYKIKGGVLYVNYSTGYKAPTLNELYGQWGSNENLMPEKSRSIEIGTRVALRKTVQLHVNIFQRTIRNSITYLSGKYINNDLQKDWGVEIMPSWKLHPYITLSSSYTLTNGQITTKNDYGQDSTFYNLYRRPKHLFQVKLLYRPNGHFTVSTHLQMLGKRKDVFVDPVDYSSSIVDLKAYQLLNCHISYSIKKPNMSLYVIGRNLLNQNYMEVIGYTTMPITIDAGVSIDW